MVLPGSKAFLRKKAIPKTHKVEPRAQIGYLVGYEAWNIFRIWNPKDGTVTRHRDVDFDESKRYDPRHPFIEDLLKDAVDPPTFTIEMPAPKQRIIDIEEPETSNLVEEADEINPPRGADEIDPPEDNDVDLIPPPEPTSEELSTRSKGPMAGSSMQLITPEMTPEPTSRSNDHDLVHAPPVPATRYYEPRHAPEGRNLRDALELSRAQPSNEAPNETTALERPRLEIRSDILPDHIVNGPRSRKRKEAYATLLQQPHLNEAIYAAFMTGTRRIHRDELPPPPKNWRELQKHPHRAGFNAAMRKEYQAVADRGTFVIEPRPYRHQVLPLIWVFTYKFDMDGYLLKYKARLCVRGDLQQQTIHDTYAATLAARSFRAVAALIAVFDLDAIQLDAINAFINSLLNKVVYYELPPGF